MAQLKLLGSKFEIIDNPELAAVWGDLMGEVAADTAAHKAAGSPPIDGIDNAKDFKKSDQPSQVLEAIRTKFPKLMQSASEAWLALRRREMEVDTFIVRGDRLHATAGSRFRGVSTVTYPIR